MKKHDGFVVATRHLKTLAHQLREEGNDSAADVIDSYYRLVRLPQREVQNLTVALRDGKSPRRLTPEEKTEVVARVRSGEHWRDVAKDMGLGPDTVRVLVTEHGLRQRRKEYMISDKRRALNLYQQGVGAPAIAKRLGFSDHKIVYRWARQEGMWRPKQGRISDTAQKVIDVLAQQGQATCRELQEACGVSRNSINSAVKTLERRHFATVDFVPGPTGPRRVIKLKIEKVQIWKSLQD